ncbi:MAG: hypothetical protein HN478_19765 [Rhodospirillaceae bacterium]|jgi:cytochrome c|nr:hypothetical protein [Rhodospirillaceae bacterium]MBT4490300.1 hypothetical protein [Rhodospirillaceae bacterium]MBT5190721.1 hypothetical protein [Rhodospirillaceae bacterium]MBT5895198.1 hypothetical protein [Rhodospirillaceae bacterium]MBT6430297.1 hypothetical protein [Rhodospirillaceae bacterium]
MKTAPRQFVSLFLAVLVAVAAFEAGAKDFCRRPGTPLEAKALAEKAADHLAEVGPEQAFTDFMTPGGEFVPFDLYVFVFDRRGKLWANGRFPGLIGSVIAGTQDSQGGPNWTEAMRRADRDGSTWIEYAWYNPCTGKPMAKSSHIIKIGPFFVGVGAYGRMSA